MIELTLGQVAAVIQGTLHGADPTARVTGSVEFDSRLVRPGGLFVAFGFFIPYFLMCAIVRALRGRRRLEA